MIKPDANPAPQIGHDALSGAPQVVELADQLSSFADGLHERIMLEIRSHAGLTIPEAKRDAMRALFDDETLLRQRANSLYADAAAFAIQGLGRPQAHLIELTKDAAQKIRRIGMIGETAGLVGGLLALAGAAMAGKPGGIVLALEKIRLHNDTLKLLSPTLPAAT